MMNKLSLTAHSSHDHDMFTVTQVSIFAAKPVKEFYSFHAINSFKHLLLSSTVFNTILPDSLFLKFTERDQFINPFFFISPTSSSTDYGAYELSRSR